MIKQKGYINGKLIDSENRVAIYSPIDNKKMGTIPLTSVADIDLAFESAKEAQQLWKQKTRDQRIDYVERFLELLRKSERLFVNLLMIEVGKSIPDAKNEMINTYRYIEDTVHNYYNLYLTEVDASDMRDETKSASIILDPLGVVLALTPYNSPIRTSLSKIIPALITGNTVVFKPQLQGAIIASELMKLFHASNFPKGTINLIVCEWEEFGKYLVTHPLATKIIFAGKTEIGNEISKITSMKNVSLELGGNSAAVVFPNVNINKVASEIIKGAFTYSGQNPIAIKRVIAHKSIRVDLMNEIKRQLSTENIVGLPKDDALVVPVVDLAVAERQKTLINDALEHGAKLLTGGIIEGNFVQPTVFFNCSLDLKLVQEDQFGPVLPILEFKDTEEAIRLTNGTKYGLQVSIYTSNIDMATEIGSEIEVGSVNINGIPSIQPDILPYTGYKSSGLGIQGISYAIKSVTSPKPFVFNKFKN